MQIDSLAIHQFRNIDDAEVHFGEGFNVFFGDNGEGKSNLLEALFFSCSLRSFRTHRAQELIALNKQEAVVAARATSQNIQRFFKTEISPQKKRCSVDGKAVRNFKKHALEFIMVFFGPDDLWIMKGPPSGRRHFLDRSILNIYPGYEKLKKEYEKVLKHRNSLLKDQEKGLPDMALLDVLDQQLVVFGDKIIDLRQKYLDKNRQILAENSASILGKEHLVESFYETKEVDGSYKKNGEKLGEKIKESRHKDLARRQTTIGPHKDDLIFYLDGQKAFGYASQGQLRSVILSWKMTEIEFIRNTVDASPILLLDDVSSELDTGKNTNLFGVLNEKGHQCFITTTDKNHVKITQNRCDFSVVSGKIKPL